MLTVKKPEEVNEVIFNNFEPIEAFEEISISDALGKTLAEDIVASEFIPAFNRSTVDGYAVIAKDSFGASDSNAIILELKKEIAMGEMVTETLKDRIVSNLHCSVISQYANEENGVFGQSEINGCPTTMNLNRANCYIEILKLRYFDVINNSLKKLQKIMKTGLVATIHIF